MSLVQDGRIPEYKRYGNRFRRRGTRRGVSEVGLMNPTPRTGEYHNGAAR